MVAARDLYFYFTTFCLVIAGFSLMAIQGSTSAAYHFPPGLPGAPAMDATGTVPSGAVSITLDTLQRGMGKGVLNASRSAIDTNRLAGLKEEDALFMVGQRHLLKTGVPPADRAVEKAAELFDFVPQATQDALTDALRWGGLGGMSISLGAAASFFLLKLGKAEEKAPPGFRLVFTLVYGMLAGVAIGVGGFLYSLLSHLQQVRLHLSRDPADLKAKKKI